MSKVTKETRRESYRTVLSNLGERQQLVIEALKGSSGDMTAREIAFKLFNEGLIPTPERNMVHPRLNELVDLDIVKVTGKKLDVSMNRKVATYRLVV